MHEWARRGGRTGRSLHANGVVAESSCQGDTATDAIVTSQRGCRCGGGSGGLPMPLWWGRCWGGDGFQERNFSNGAETTV